MCSRVCEICLVCLFRIGTTVPGFLFLAGLSLFMLDAVADFLDMDGFVELVELIIMVMILSFVWYLAKALVSSSLAFVSNLTNAVGTLLYGLLAQTYGLLNRVVQWYNCTPMPSSPVDTAMPAPTPATTTTSDTARRPLNHDFAAPALTPQGHWKLHVITQCVLMCASGSPAHEVAQRCGEMWCWDESREQAVQEVIQYATGRRHGNAELLLEDMLARVLANDRVADEDPSHRVRAGFDESMLTYRGLMKLLVFKLLAQMIQDGRTEQDVNHQAEKAWPGERWDQVVEEVYRFNSERLHGCSTLKLQFLLAQLLVNDHLPAPVQGVALPSPVPLAEIAPPVSNTCPVEAR